MPCRTDAGRTLALMIFGACMFGTGCAGLARREPPPAAPVRSPEAAAQAPAASPPATLPQLTDAAPLAITAAPAQERSPSDHRPAKHEQPTPAPGADLDHARRLYRDAAAAYARQASYIARLRRREWANGRPKPEETMLFKFREQPWSVHLKWLGEEGRGREVLYVRGQHGDKLHVLTAANDIPFTAAGKRMAVDPNSVLVRSASRYPITEAGIGKVIERIGRVIEAASQRPNDITTRYVGPINRPEYPVPLTAIEFTLPPQFSPEIPLGGKRLGCFDPVTKFPVLSITWDEAGREVDFVCLDRFQLDVRLDDDDFHPDRLWSAPAGK